MKRQALSEDDRYLNVRMTADLYRRLRVTAAERDMSVTHLINLWLEEKAAEVHSEKEKHS